MKNEPAFPTGIFTDEKGIIVGGSNGMTLRDYFAAKALQALIARETKLHHDILFYAGAAYDVADAMLEARGE